MPLDLEPFLYECDCPTAAAEWRMPEDSERECFCLSCGAPLRLVGWIDPSTNKAYSNGEKPVSVDP